MSESGNESINEFAQLVRRVRDLEFLKALLSYMTGDSRKPTDDITDMKEHMIMFVRGRKHNKHIRQIISDRIDKLERGSQSGGRRRTKRKIHRKNRKTHRRS